MTMKHFAMLLLATILSACALPQTVVQSGSMQPGLIIKGARIGSILFVDGLEAGPAAQFDGKPKVLAVLDGVHVVEIRQGATILFSEKVLMAGGETHTVDVGAGSAK
jgi:signal peptidase I